MLIDIGNVDWPLLRKQKRTLLEEAAKREAKNESDDDLMGIVHLIDHIQDAAAQVIPEAVVFGKSFG